MNMFDANLTKYVTFKMTKVLFEVPLEHCYEHFGTKNVVHLTFFRKIVNEMQCLDCGNDQI